MKKSMVFNVFTYILSVVFNIALVAATVYFIYKYTLIGYNFGTKLTDTSKMSTEYREVTLTIKDGATISEVAEILEENELIGNAFLYTFEAILKGNNKTFKGGTFILNTDMDKAEMTRTLRTTEKAVSTDIKITIKEGYTTKDIAEYLEAKEIVTKEEFLEACANGKFNYDFLKDVQERENRLEGYLFPDTYLIAENATSEQIINKMLSRFDEIFDYEMRNRSEEMGLTIDQVVTMASIIEKEIKVPEEREKAAAVIYNRLDIDMSLQMCSTILYVLDKRKDFLLDEDLQVQSPYNTYLNTGLPVGPISNPGESCLRAALNPADDKYLYFVVMNEETGEHFFTNSYDDFLNAKAEYKQKY